MVQFDVKRVQKGSESFMVSFDYAKTPITQIADYIIIAASKHGTSDIHFDPREDGMMVRFRIDGDCQDYTFVPKAYEKNLTTRLKLLANMNITESRLPQDGAIKGDFGGQYLDMRVSALPLNYGEKIVIRILDYSRSLQGVDSLGFHPKNLEKIKRMMGLPNGIILTTGATGSGKSTTTYSILQGLNKPEMNVITVEDPIEMNIEGINQVQVNAEIGMTFAAALRSILRQDPNVILIGEIRDSETAQIAVRASITGHLVLSTIHTNNALATVERLLDMDVERYLLSTALSGIISQRLAKQLCPDCKYQRETTPYEKKVFKKYMKMDVPMVWDANPKGCDHCRRGYHGRIAVHEVLEIDENIRNALSDEKLDKEDLRKMVYSGSTITMLQDALIKCLEGKTSFEEVYRTIEIENEDDDNYENEIASEIKDNIPVDDQDVEESDDLLDIKVSNDDDNVSVQVPQSFTAADFADAPEEETDEVVEGEDESQNSNQVASNSPNINQSQVLATQQSVSQTQAPATQYQAASQTQVPATQYQVASQAQVPATQYQVASQAQVPATQYQVASQTQAPATQYQVTPQAQAPATQYQVASQAQVPVTQYQVASQAQVPTTQYQVASQTQVPTTQYQVASQAQVPTAQYKPTYPYAAQSQPAAVQSSMPITQTNNTLNGVTANREMTADKINKLPKLDEDLIPLVPKL